MLCLFEIGASITSGVWEGSIHVNKSPQSIFRSFHNENIWPALGSNNQYLCLSCDDLVDADIHIISRTRKPNRLEAVQFELYAL